MLKLTPSNIISREAFERVLELLEKGGLPYHEIARQSGISSPRTVFRIAEGTHYYQTGEARCKPKRKTMPKQVGPRREDRRKAYLPTPEQIAAACKKIRATWREDEEESDWQPPVISTLDLIGI